MNELAEMNAAFETWWSGVLPWEWSSPRDCAELGWDAAILAERARAILQSQAEAISQGTK